MQQPRAVPATIAAMLALAACRPLEPPTPARLPADLLVSGGRVRTMDPAMPEASVLVVKDGRVLAAGGSELLGRYEARERLALRGRSVVPGLIDAHAHFLGLGRAKDELDLRGLASYDDVVAKVREAAERTPKGEFILGRGWNQELWPGERLPTHDALSEASPDHPVLLRRVDGHATLANAAAMALAGIATGSASPPGGEILRDPEGRPTGLFVDAAVDLLPRPPGATEAQRERWALAAQEACLASGLTGVHDAGVDEDALALFERLMAQGRLVIRLNAMLEGRFGEDGAPLPWLAARLATGPVSGALDGRLSIRAVKIYADGALGSRGAALLEPYSDRPESRGLMQISQESLVARVRACRAAGFQAAVHAIGDAANRSALDAFEAVLGAEAGGDHRFRVEHAQVIASSDIRRFAKLGVIASMQPTHATSDMNMAEERVGPRRLEGAYAWRSLLSSGARLALGSDFPVERENPFWGIFAACERTDHAGLPAGGWLGHERLTREEAIRGFTTDAAFAGFDENDVGALSPGRRADFLVLPADPLTCPAAELVTLRPDETWVGGRRAWSRADAAR